MFQLLTHKSPPLSGIYQVGSAKNAVLPLMAASLLTDEESVLHHVPEFADVNAMLEILQSLGGSAERRGADLCLRAIGVGEPADTWVQRLRASFLIMGPLLARRGHVVLPLPGGCAIGTRPIDLHLLGLSELGAHICVRDGYVHATASALRGTHIRLPFPSVGATENIVMAACLAHGRTFLENAALEPEIEDLCTCLIRMGARISGVGTSQLVIDGVEQMHAVHYTPIPDRIEAGTVMMAAAATGGDVLLQHIVPQHLGAVFAALERMGASLDIFPSSARIRMQTQARAIDVIVSPYPGFPTDLQAQLMAVCSLASGTSRIQETVFENRFKQVDALSQMGANIHIQSEEALIHGVSSLRGAHVEATDLRAGAAMVIAGLAAQGDTRIANVHHIDRGYDAIEKKLQPLGAPILRC